MSRLVWVLLFGLGFGLVCCGESPQQVCEQLVRAECQKQKECFNQGADVEQCVADALAKSSCSTPCADFTKTYKVEFGTACAKEFAALACADLLSGQTQVKAPSCAKTCQ